MSKEKHMHWDMAEQNPVMFSIVKEKKGRQILWERQIDKLKGVTTIDVKGTLVKEGKDWLGALIFDRDPRVLPKRHRPIAVEPAHRIHRHGQRIDVETQSVSVTKEIAQRRLD